MAHPRTGVLHLVRALSPADSLVELTALLHRAYARLAEAGWNYTAVDQDVETTRRRATRGACLVAEVGGRVVGTLSLWRGGPEEGDRRFADPSSMLLGQFAVEPSMQGLGIGGALLAEAERSARESGASEVLGDTAEGAIHLVRLYERRGFRVVGRVRWPGKSYASVVLAKPLDGRGDPEGREAPARPSSGGA